MKRIAVLLTVHNRKEKTLKCLETLYQQSLPDDVIQVVYLTDDGCTDGTRAAICERFPEVVIVDGDGNLFWNRGMIAAWQKASKERNDYYLWINDDTFIYNYTVERLLDCSDKHHNKAIIVGTTCDVMQKGKLTYGGRINGELVENVQVEQRCDTFNGNIVLVPCLVFRILGTLDSYYHHSLGDYDYGFRAKENGIEAWIAPGILGECNHHENLTIWKDPNQPLKKRCLNFFSPLGNNPIEFFHFRRKHYGLIPACITFVSNFIHLLFPKFWIPTESSD